MSDLGSDLKCKECNHRSKSNISLCMHLKKAHNMLLKDYIIKYVYNNVCPECSCGCTFKVEWNKGKSNFNKFVNGHNNKFTAKHQPIITKEQVAVRNQKIKSSYDERQEIKEKISSSVKKALSDSKFDFSKFHKELWSNLSYIKSQKLSRILSWSGPAGVQRRLKVFNEQFSMKISAVNLKRDLKKKSNSEKQFINYLKSIHDPCDIIEDYWVFSDGKAFCFDAFVVSKNMLIEFDGEFYHAINKKNDFTPVQLKNIANDFRKNMYAAKNGYSLIRISDMQGYETCKSISQIEQVSYHKQTPEVILDGMLELDDDCLIITGARLEKIKKLDNDYFFKTVIPVSINFFKWYCIYRNIGFSPCEAGLTDLLSTNEDISYSKIKNIINKLTC
jgi:hypothetical protein